MKFSLITLTSLIFLASCASRGPITATSNELGSSKGEACKRNILFILPLSTDNSIYSAAKEGKIAKISTVDHHDFISIFYNTHCTVVHGSKDEAELKIEKIEKVEKPIEEVKVEKVVPAEKVVEKPKMEGIEEPGLKMIEDTQLPAEKPVNPLDPTLEE
ncbi:MAG: TRL domain-containing protein [Bdellovibrionota bacterium]